MKLIIAGNLSKIVFGWKQCHQTWPVSGRGSPAVSPGLWHPRGAPWMERGAARGHGSLHILLTDPACPGSNPSGSWSSNTTRQHRAGPRPRPGTEDAAPAARRVRPAVAALALPPQLGLRAPTAPDENLFCPWTAACTAPTARQAGRALLQLFGSLWILLLYHKYLHYTLRGLGVTTRAGDTAKGNGFKLEEEKFSWAGRKKFFNVSMVRH